MSDDPKRPDDASTPKEVDAVRSTVPDMTRERARSERRDLDKERGEPLAGGAESCPLMSARKSWVSRWRRES